MKAGYRFGEGLEKGLNERLFDWLLTCVHQEGERLGGEERGREMGGKGVGGTWEPDWLDQISASQTQDSRRVKSKIMFRISTYKVEKGSWGAWQIYHLKLQKGRGTAWIMFRDHILYSFFKLQQIQDNLV